MNKLTGKQRTVLDFLRAYMTQQGKAPFIREIQAGCNIRSYKSTVDYLNALERKRLIRRQLSLHRGIELIQQLEEVVE